jgi:Cdc6-like AAA superfamily ATPase
VGDARSFGVITTVHGAPTMAEKKKLEDVFKTVGLPPYTYIKPPYYGEVRADITQPGKHLLIEGPSGIGKTCVAFKAFEELKFEQNKDFRCECRRND